MGSRTEPRRKDRIALSVIVPSYNSGPLLENAVASILEQESTVPGLEVIVVDDRSTDPGTLARLERLPAKDARIRVLSNWRPRGPSGARNTGIEAARGEWIGFLDDDDLWVPGGLQARWEIIEARPDARFVSGDFAHLHEDGSVAEPFYRTRPIPREVLAAAFETDRPLRLGNPVLPFLRAVLVHTAVVLVRRSLLEATGGFDEDLFRAEDDHLWLRVALRADLFFVPRVVALYRQRAGSLTQRDEPPATWNLVAYEKLLRSPEFRAHRGRLRKSLARFALADSDYFRAKGAYMAAARSAATAVRWDPANRRAWRSVAGSLLRRG